MKLNQDNLNKMADHVILPSYDRSVLKAGIVHIGVGGFHRSHQAYYIHRLLQKSPLNNWAICGIGLLNHDHRIIDVLNNQDGLYTLITQYPDGRETYEVIGSIKELLLAPENPDLVIEKMAHGDTKIVSLTITEGGYNFNTTTGAFNFENPDIQHELKNTDDPKTIYGYLTAALRMRRERGLPPFTILSCDNIQHNGDMARRMVLAYVRKQDIELAKWIEEKVSFPNTMVDRITPVTTSTIVNTLKDNNQIEDAWPVVCEPFIQWVIEDKFSCGRPPLEKLGVQFVPDVSPYEKMKIRLLNAGHSVLGIPGAIHGHATIADCMADSVLARFMRRFMDKEVSPILEPVEGIDIETYKDTLEERFSNPNIKDNVSRICAESSAKLPKFLIPTIVDNLQNNGSIKYATFLIAAWCYYSEKRINEKGGKIEIIDALKDVLHNRAKNTTSNWIGFLNQPDIFGDLIDNERFTQEYTKTVQALYAENNIRKLMIKYT